VLGGPALSRDAGSVTTLLRWETLTRMGPEIGAE